jgi:phthiocerol/phenolphthiocerol synthesis type-I polyketide synthase C
VDQVQPALWATSVSLAAVWRAAGVAPHVVIGHSQGEIAAATVAGALTVEDGARIVGRRSALLREVAGHGRMLAVDLSPAAATAALAGFEDAVSLAVHNGPSSCVLSGETDAVLLLREILEADGVYCRLVDVDYASHSPQVDPLLPRVESALADVAPRPATCRCSPPSHWTSWTGRSSTLPTGRPTCAVVCGSPSGRRRRRRRGDPPGGDQPAPRLLSAALGQLAEEHENPPVVLTTLRRGEGGAADLQHALARAWTSGLPALGARSARRPAAVVPGYPWQRQRYCPPVRVAAPAARIRSRSTWCPAPAVVPGPGRPSCRSAAIHGWPTTGWATRWSSPPGGTWPCSSTRSAGSTATPARRRCRWRTSACRRPWR